MREQVAVLHEDDSMCSPGPLNNHTKEVAARGEKRNWPALSHMSSGRFEPPILHQTAGLRAMTQELFALPREDDIGVS